MVRTAWTFHLEQLLHRLADLDLIRLGIDDEDDLIPRFLLARALLRNQGPFDDLMVLFHDLKFLSTFSRLERRKNQMLVAQDVMDVQPLDLQDLNPGEHYARIFPGSRPARR